MPGINYESRKNYLSIAQGAIRQTVSEHTPGGIRRDYETSDGTKGYKFEFVYKSWEGKIIDIRVKDGKFGEVCEIEFDDAVLSLGTSGRYFMDLIKKLRNININRTVTLTPYDFESDGKKLVGVSVVQNGEKIPNYYWDKVKEKTVNGFPIPTFNTRQAKTRDWDKYWIDVTEFLVSEIEKIRENIKKDVIERVDDDEKVENEIPVIGEDTTDFSFKDDDEIQLSDVPF